MTAVDYRRAKSSALQQLAGSGDQAARRELERRGESVGAVRDVTSLDSGELRRLVRAWNTGGLPEDRSHNFALARHAFDELTARYRAALALQAPLDPTPQPPVAPWLAPRTPRCAGWARPTGSTCYPSEVEIARAAFDDLARHFTRT